MKDLRDGRVIITSQNHGFAVDQGSLPNCLEATHVSLFDHTLQGIHRTDRPAFGFQGHPERARGQRPRILFDHFIELDERGARSRCLSERTSNRFLIIGAGPIVIGQACEFDYSGAQACKALRDEGYRVVLVNSIPRRS